MEAISRTKINKRCHLLNQYKRNRHRECRWFKEVRRITVWRPVQQMLAKFGHPSKLSKNNRLVLLKWQHSRVDLRTLNRKLNCPHLTPQLRTWTLIWVDPWCSSKMRSLESLAQLEARDLLAKSHQLVSKVPPLKSIKLKNSQSSSNLRELTRLTLANPSVNLPANPSEWISSKTWWNMAKRKMKSFPEVIIMLMMMTMLTQLRKKRWTMSVVSRQLHLMESKSIKISTEIVLLKSNRLWWQNSSSSSNCKTMTQKKRMLLEQSKSKKKVIITREGDMQTMQKMRRLMMMNLISEREDKRGGHLNKSS